MSPSPVDARYGYSVWLRHIATLDRAGVRGPFSTVVELGPGNSVATGICAILSGSARYIGLDVIRHVSHRSGMTVFRELKGLFDAREPIPGPHAFPMVRPTLSDYGFPASVPEIVSQERRADSREALLREDLDAIASGGDGGEALRYVVPWTSHSVAPGTVDLVFSQAALQEIPHRDEARSPLRNTIEATSRWLKPGGVASHQIDFGFYGMQPWNVHWTWHDWTWKLLRGRRDNFVNREPLSTYVSLMQENGLSIVAIVPDEGEGVPDTQLSPRYRVLPENERRTRSAHLIVRKDHS